MSLFSGTPKTEILRRLDQFMVRAIPFNVALGLTIEDADEGVATMRLPYRPELVGNPETGVLHGGMMTAMLDAACGMSVFLKIQKVARIATLDLRIDYLHPATPPRDVIARAECYRTTRDVAFVRALAHHGDPTDPIAAAAGTFAIFGAPA
jgi:uncharacterized protein (TIGR00369 family)